MAWLWHPLRNKRKMLVLWVTRPRSQLSGGKEIGGVSRYPARRCSSGQQGAIHHAPCVRLSKMVCCSVGKSGKHSSGPRSRLGRHSAGCTTPQSCRIGIYATLRSKLSLWFLRGWSGLSGVRATKAASVATLSLAAVWRLGHQCLRNTRLLSICLLEVVMWTVSVIKPAVCYATAVPAAILSVAAVEMFVWPTLSVDGTSR